jgi:hypothetical protein
MAFSALGQPLEKPVAVGEEEEEEEEEEELFVPAMALVGEVVDAADDVLLTRHEVSCVLVSSFPLGLLQNLRVPYHHIPSNPTKPPSLQHSKY